MCGIIGYLGDRAIGLSRILGAMASILYRAPDSTGAAWFGDEAEPSAEAMVWLRPKRGRST